MAHADADSRRLLYRTHVDAAHIAHENGQLSIKVIDGQKPIDPNSVHVRLGPDADATGVEVSRIKVPADERFSFLGKPGEVLWNAPGALYDGWAPVWAGFGVGEFPTEFLRTIRPESVRLELVGVDGPGELEVWAGDATYVGRQFSSRDTSLRVRHMIPGAHGHFNWTFSQPGRYQVKWRAHADLRDGAPFPPQSNPSPGWWAPMPRWACPPAPPAVRESHSPLTPTRVAVAVSFAQ